MTLTLYSTSDDNRVVNKTLTLLGTATIRPTEALDLMSPNFIIDMDNTYLGANYCYCDTLGRYYYITNISLETGRRMVLHCSIDVLKTYATDLASVKATVIRSASVGAPTAIPDKKLPIDPHRYELKSIKFAKSFTPDINKPCYLLIT